MKNKLLFDGIATQSDTNVKFHGGGEYAKYILREIIKSNNVNFDIVFSIDKFIDPEIKKLVQSVGGINIYTVRNKKELYSLISKNNYSSFYSALPYKYFDYCLEIPFIMVIHGLRGLELVWDEYRYKYSKNYTEKLLFKMVTNSEYLKKLVFNRRYRILQQLIEIKNSKIITVSEHSKYSILNFFPKIKPENVFVNYSPFDYSVKEINAMHTDLKKDYFLIISANRFEKNSYRLIKAFDNLFSKQLLESKKVIVLGSNQLPFNKEIKNIDKFELLPYVSEDELYGLYKNSFAFVYPSLNEGFGYPPLTAMKYGIPVIASSSTSIPEVCGNAAVYFDSKSVCDMSNRILQIYYDSNLYQHLIKNGIKRITELKLKQEKEIENMIKMIFN
jgi:glycosyltransferase involved in cell wall biosynthesis